MEDEKKVLILVYFSCIIAISGLVALYFIRTSNQNTNTEINVQFVMCPSQKSTQEQSMEQLKNKIKEANFLTPLVLSNTEDAFQLQELAVLTARISSSEIDILIFPDSIDSMFNNNILFSDQEIAAYSQKNEKRTESSIFSQQVVLDNQKYICTIPRKTKRLDQVLKVLKEVR